MAASHKGSITFGLVHIPVGLHPAVQDTDIHFNQLCRKDMSRVKYKKICTVCEKELCSPDIVKGYEYEPDKYVPLENSDFEDIKTKKDKSIHICTFTDISSIFPIYFEKSYYTVPDSGGEKAFELLRKAMLSENKIAIAKTVMGTKEKLMALIPSENGIMTEILHFKDEIKEIVFDYDIPPITNSELQMAKFMIGMMETPFIIEHYKDEYQQKLKDMINCKIKGKEYSKISELAEAESSNIEETLKRSIEMLKNTYI